MYKVFPDYFTNDLLDLLDEWSSQSDPDPANWQLKPGAPEEVVRAWPDYLKVMSAKDPADRFPEGLNLPETKD